MTAPRFLIDTAALTADRIHLAGAEGRHAAAVRRLRVGEPVDLTDGAGHVVEGIVTAAGRDWLDIDAVRRHAVPRPDPRLVVAQALVKGERAELAVEMLTEVGVDAVIPWQAVRSVVRWEGERGVKALGRWRSTAREAAKQARRAWVPVVEDALSTQALVERVRVADWAVVLHETATAPLARLSPPASGELLLLVGPEGGIADDELAALAAAGADIARLGPSVLRASTAGVAAAALVLGASGRWSV